MNVSPEKVMGCFLGMAIGDAMGRAVNGLKPEAIRQIFGAIEDINLNGKIRVSIVATALDGHKTENRTVLNMFSRIQNRNTGYSENLFSHNPRVENNTLSSIEGATALKLDESYQLEEEQSSLPNGMEDNFEVENSINTSTETEKVSDVIPAGVSIESASYIENTIEKDTRERAEEPKSNEAGLSNLPEEEYTPKLFSDDSDVPGTDSSDNLENSEYKDNLFEEEISEEDDFEIPAFLRRQKF